MSNNANIWEVGGGQNATSYMPVAGGTFTGDVLGITKPKGDNSNSFATTAFVYAAIVALGMGTLGLQNANAVSITGGSINDTVIGGATPAAITGTTGTFTSTLSAGDTTLSRLTITTNTSFASVAGARLYKDAAYGTALQAVSGTSNDFALLTAAGNLLLTAAKGGTRLMVAGATDDGSTALQVAGGGKFSSGLSIGYNTSITSNTSGVPLAITNGNGSSGSLLQGSNQNGEVFHIYNDGTLYLHHPATTGAGPSYFQIRIPDAAGNRGGIWIGTEDNGALAGLAGQVVTVGGYPNSVGRLDAWVQNGSVTQIIQSWFAGGRTAIGLSPSDNGTDSLQVNGTALVKGTTNNLMVGRFQNSDTVSVQIGATSGAAAANDIGLIQAYNRSGAATALVLQPNSGNVLVGTTTNNGTDALQVNGSVALTNINWTTTNDFQLGGAVYCKTDNYASCGGASYRWVAVYAVNGTVQTSDARYKTFTGPSLGLDFINRLETHTGYWTEKGESDGLHQWLSAQQVEATLIKLGVKSFAGLSKPKDAPMGLQYSELIAPLIRAVQELSQRVKQLEGAA